MKKKLIALSLMMAASAQAREIKVFDKSVYELGYNPYISQEFVVNEDLGRAWIEVTVSDNDPDSSADEYRVKVEGLSYDKTIQSVVLEYEGQLVTCATFKVRGRSIFRHRLLVLNERCRFRGAWKEIIYDDGFEMKKTSKYQIDLVVE